MLKAWKVYRFSKCSLYKLFNIKFLKILRANIIMSKKLSMINHFLLFNLQTNLLNLEIVLINIFFLILQSTISL